MLLKTIQITKKKKKKIGEENNNWLVELFPYHIPVTRQKDGE